MSDTPNPISEKSDSPNVRRDEGRNPGADKSQAQQIGGSAVSDPQGQGPSSVRNSDQNQQNSDQNQQNNKQASFLPVIGVSKAKKKRSWVKPLLFGVLGVAILFGILWGVRYWHYSQTHVSTDDAYVNGDLVSISPIISGTLQQVTVDEGSYVRRGQLVARLDDAGPQANLRQARANYIAALSQIPQAQRNLRYQQQATDAAIRKAQASLGVQQAKTTGAQQQVTLASGTTRNQVRQAQSQIQAAQAQVAQSLAQARAAEASVENYQQSVQTALASLENYQQQVLTAQKAAQAAQARVQAAQTEGERTTKDEARYRLLYMQDAVAAQVYDNARAQARNAQANLQANQSQAEEAQSQVEQARSSVKQAQSQVEQARKNVTQAQAQARAARSAADAAQEQVNVARAGLGLARANSTQVGIQEANLLSTTREAGAYEADVANARAGKEQVEVRRKQIDTYRAQAQQALAALNNAQITLNDTYLTAPSDGTILKKAANPGTALTPGQTILTMTRGNHVWVEANFKETQLKDVRPGQSAEIEVDAVPGKIFKGRVRSINEATGAALSLLPPDNATGNFTKVVQRIPVRIEIVAARKDDDAKYAREEAIRNLRQGMSVVATIDTSHREEDHKGAQDQRGDGSAPMNAPMNGPSEPNGNPNPLPNPDAGALNSDRQNNSSDRQNNGPDRQNNSQNMPSPIGPGSSANGTGTNTGGTGHVGVGTGGATGSGAGSSGAAGAGGSGR